MCNKGFCHRQSLVTHSTLHTGIKPYQCESCYNSFSCVGNLLKHRKTHADTCGKIPLTTHRVKHPATKLKVQVNTPATIKIKTTKKQKQLLSLQNQDASQNSELSEDNNLSDNNAVDESYGNEEVLPFESKMFVKEEEKWIPTTVEIAEEKNSQLNDEKTTEFWVKDEEHFQEKKEILAELENITDETVDKKSDENTEEYWDNDGAHSDASVSEDSTDLITRQEKQTIEEKKDKPHKKPRKKRCKADREKLKQFIKDRNFGDLFKLQTCSVELILIFL